MSKPIIYYRFRLWWFNKAAKHIPLICAPRPKPPYCECKSCGQTLKLMAVDTGDGWDFFFDCDDACDPIWIEWWPFLFGAWCGRRDLELIGIETW